MEALADLEKERGNPEYLEDTGKRHASREMCTFLVMNISSLQLIPINMIAYRSQYGSPNPTAILAPSILATFVSTIFAIIYCKLVGGTKKKNKYCKERQ